MRVFVVEHREKYILLKIAIICKTVCTCVVMQIKLVVGWLIDYFATRKCFPSRKKDKLDLSRIFQRHLWIIKVLTLLPKLIVKSSGFTWVDVKEDPIRKQEFSVLISIPESHEATCVSYTAF